MPKTTVGAVIVAAGRSERMGRTDKLWAPLPSKNGREEPLIAHTLTAFQRSKRVNQAILVLAESTLEEGRRLVREHGFDKFTVVAGGGRRQDSVLPGSKRLMTFTGPSSMTAPGRSSQKSSLKKASARPRRQAHPVAPSLYQTR